MTFFWQNPVTSLRANQRRYTKKQFEEYFRAEVLPFVSERYEGDRIPDWPARREAWNDTVDSLIRDGLLPESAGNWPHPRWVAGPRR